MPRTFRPSLDAFHCIAGVCDDAQVLAPVLENLATLCWINPGVEPIKEEHAESIKFKADEPCKIWAPNPQE